MEFEDVCVDNQKPGEQRVVSHNELIRQSETAIGLKQTLKKKTGFSDGGGFRICSQRLMDLEFDAIFQ